MLIYLDTSAALKVLVNEAETPQLREYLDGLDLSHLVVSSMLLYTELHCSFQRRNLTQPATATSLGVDQFLAGITLWDLERADLWRAARSRWGLRSADAIHLATALRAECDVLLAYDKELLAAAQDNDLAVLSPGA